MRKKIIMMLSVATLGIMASCNKKSNSIEKTPDQASTHVKTSTISLQSNFTWANAANANNPYDNVGYMHNQCLYYILSNVNNNNITSGNIYEAGYNFVGEEYGSPSAEEFSQMYAGSNFGAFAQDLANSGFDFHSTVENLNASEDVKNKLNELVTLATDNSSEQDQNFTSLKSKIVIWESSVISNNYNDEDKKILLSTSSILRYSVLGWSDGSFKGTGSELAQTMGWRWWQYAIVGLADAVGGAGAGVLTGGNPIFIGAGAAVCSGGAAILME